MGTSVSRDNTDSSSWTTRHALATRDARRYHSGAAAAAVSLARVVAHKVTVAAVPAAGFLSPCPGRGVLGLASGSSLRGRGNLLCRPSALKQESQIATEYECVQESSITMCALRR